MLVRIQSPEGQARIKAEPNEPITSLFDKIAAQLKLTKTFSLSRSTKADDIITVSDTQTLSGARIKHGDMLYLSFLKTAEAGAPDPVLDEVDAILDGLDGMVKRERDPRLCHESCGTGTRSCLHCLPLSPFDPAVLSKKDPPIKFLAFHSYIRQLQSGADHGRMLNLEEENCKINKDCKHCPGWPKSICTKCQPQAITVKRQTFRHVDYVEFASPTVVNTFIEAWRKGGVQRIGYMYGRYEPYDFVPLGIKAVVHAIYEPPQTGAADGLELRDDEHETLLDGIASKLNLQRVGWIFTDLEAEGTKGSVRYKRFISDTTTVFSAGEVLQAALMQSTYPNMVASKYSLDGKYGSKFVTCVVSGGEDKTVQITAFQATNQATSMARAELLAPSTRAANAMYVHEASDDLYVPEVHYQTQNEYGKEVKIKAEPEFPSDYLHVQLQTGSGTGAGFADLAPFVVENRGALGESQDLAALHKRFNGPGSLMLKCMDLHVMYFLATNAIVPLGDDINGLLESIASGEEMRVEGWAAMSPKWATLIMLMSESSMMDQGAMGGW